MAQLWCSYKLFATTQKCILLSIQSSLFLTLATRHTVAIMVTKRSREIKNQPKTIKKRNYKSFDAAAFLQDVSDSLDAGKFDTVLNATNPDIAAAHFSGIFSSILNKHAPLKTFQVRNNYVPWISNETKEAIKKRDKLKVEALAENDMNKLNDYKVLRNRIKKQLVTDKTEYYKGKFYNKEASVGSIWNTVNDYLGTSQKSHSNTPSMLIQNNTAFTAPRDVANTFNNFFLNKVENLTRQTNGAPTIEPSERLKKWLDSKGEALAEFKLAPIDIAKLRKILSRLKGNRSCGIDFIDGYSVKLAAPVLEKVLLHLVNLNIEQSQYPQLWKNTKVNPHFKKGDRSNGENYRPVSDIIFVSKITEAAVFEQTYEHFQSHNLWHPNHHGYKAHHSTSTALAQLYDLWFGGAENKEFTAALLLDLSAAFDVVNHRILLEKLQLYNFSPATLEWFKSYLSDRSQYVMVDSRLSDPLPIGDQGVPQGSLLGPLCFIIFYNDFPAAHETGESILYADDDTDNCSSNDPNELQNMIQHEANLSTDWVHDNKLVCSGSKTKLLVIGTREMRQSKLVSTNTKIVINVGGHQVEESQSERLLGLVVNNTMTWYNHLHGNDEHKGLIPKLCQRAGLVRKLSGVMPADRLRIVANGTFFSLLSYGLQLYGTVSGLVEYSETTGRHQAMTREDSHKIQVIMNVVLRALTGLVKDTPVWQLLQVSGFLSFHQMCAYTTVCSMQKIMVHKEPKPLYDSMLAARHELERPRRAGVGSFLPYKLSISRESYLYQACRLYSKLPVNLTATTSVPDFKKKTRIWVKQTIPLYM